MFPVYLIVALVLGLLACNCWANNGVANIIIRVGFMIFTLWTALLLAGYFWKEIQNTAMRLI